MSRDNPNWIIDILFHKPEIILLDLRNEFDCLKYERKGENENEKDITTHILSFSRPLATWFRKSKVNICKHSWKAWTTRNSAIYKLAQRWGKHVTEPLYAVLTFEGYSRRKCRWFCDLLVWSNIYWYKNPSKLRKLDGKSTWNFASFLTSLTKGCYSYWDRD